MAQVVMRKIDRHHEPNHLVEVTHLIVDHVVGPITRVHNAGRRHGAAASAFGEVLDVLIEEAGLNVVHGIRRTGRPGAGF